MQTRQPTTRTVPRPDSAEQWDELIEPVVTEGGAIVESRSGTKAAVISYEEFLELQEQRRKRQIAEAYAQLQEALKGQAERNADLSQEEIEELAERASREAFDELVAGGRLIFERDEK